MALLNRPLTDERVNAIREEIDAFIAARVENEAKACPGVPPGVIRNLITRGSDCRCAVYLELKAGDAAAAHKGVA
ncbi:hypothetical protein AB4853_10430 [Bradyrhizobium sp. 1050_B9_N1_2]|uniref:hypothetical protein n=1 Tax=Bradyrhizobium sp. 1050_B9_N1_2 TaxID=3238688 RepID=UPI003EDBB6FB